MPDPTDSTDPKKPGDNPLFGATPAPTTPSPSSTTAAPDSASEERLSSGSKAASDVTGAQESGSIAPGTSEPLYGASPPAGASGDSGARERVEAGSRERVESLKRSREAALNNTSNSRPQPPRPPAPSYTRLAQAPAPGTRPPSTLIPYLRRIGFVLSLFLGASATVSMIWSVFLLPRLHASFSARRALAEQQTERVSGLLGRLKEIRGMGVHAGYKREAADDGEVGAEDAETEGKEGVQGEKGEESKAMIREISSSAHSTSSHTSDPSPATSPNVPPLLPDLTSLIDTLKNLTSTRSNTATTRTSLLSTIESYTSALHRQLWNPRPGAGKGAWGTGYGLGTLDQSLRNEGATGGATAGVYKDGWEGEGLGDRAEEWDRVRKEVRGIKGMLLGRRSMGIGA